jgi:hypothetical protein
MRRLDGTLVDGKPAGVYVSLDGVTATHQVRKWPLTIRGRLDLELAMQSAAH